MIRVDKAVIPAAGLGSRVRAVARDLPKELLSVGGKTIIQHSIEMHVSSGIGELAIILHPEKTAVMDFLEGNTVLTSTVPITCSAEFRSLLKNVSLHYFFQRERNGVVDAVMRARKFVGDEYFGLFMPDCILFSECPFPTQVMNWFPYEASGVIGFLMLDKAREGQFGNVGLLSVSHCNGPLYRIDSLSDKLPGTVSFDEDAHPKGFGGGIYSPDYFDRASVLERHPGRELDDVPIHQDLARDKKLFGVQLEGVTFDVGNIDGFRAAVDYCKSFDQRP